MTVLETKNLRDLIAFKHQEGQLAILERKPLGGGDDFLRNFRKDP